MKIRTHFLLLFALLSLSRIGSAQYLHSNGKQIVDGENHEFIMRGMGLGGWMLQEGYMLGTGNFAGTQHEIRGLMEASMGKARTDDFYKAWLANHCTKTDIDSLAAWGFNAVRLPMHYNLFTLPVEEEPVAGKDTWLGTGFKMVDNLIDWCKANNMYVILDMHATPGGQGKNASISDYDPTKPSLWESAENRRKLVALWQKLAKRYANEKYIGGYDLINETNWSFTGANVNGCDSRNVPLREMMVRLTNAIREVDQNHLIFVEGNCWANNWVDLLPPWDDNMAYSFHKYWNKTDEGTIQKFLDDRDKYNVPLWMGESGENSNEWFYETIKMLEEQKVGWSWWPMKKIGSIVGPLTAIQTPEYSHLLKIWKDGGTPDPDSCYQTLMQIAENLKIENCIYHPDVIDAMFRQKTEATTIPYKRLVVPGVVHAVDFDMGRYGVAYHDIDYMNDKGHGQWNRGHQYRNDGVDIEDCSDNSIFSNNYNVGWIEPGEWMVYTVQVKEAGNYQVTFRVAGGKKDGRFHLKIGQQQALAEAFVKASSGANWTDITVSNIQLKKGYQQMKFIADQGGFKLSYFRFEIE